MSLVKVRLFVTDKDIRVGEKCDGHGCMVARALARICKPTHDILVTQHAIRYYHRTECRYAWVDNPTFLHNKIDDWDSGRKIKRFNCMISIPAECLKDG